MENLPPAVQNTVRDQSKQAILRGLSKEVENGEAYYEAELISNGHRRDVLIDAAGAALRFQRQ